MEELDDAYIRVYEDHTGRFYKDYTKEEYDAIIEASNNDPLTQILKEEIQKEINKELMERVHNESTKT